MNLNSRENIRLSRSIYRVDDAILYEKIRPNFKKFYKCFRSFCICVCRGLGAFQFKKYFWRATGISYPPFHVASLYCICNHHRFFGFGQTDSSVSRWFEERGFYFAAHHFVLAGYFSCHNYICNIVVNENL